jgi:hypothetical protein
MNNELSTQSMQSVQLELMLAKQNAEIMSLKFELQKAQAEKSSRLEDSLFSAALFPHYQKVAETLAKSDMVPKDYRGKPDNVLVAMEMGYQLGLPVAQCLQDIAVINGRPSLWGDGLLALALSHPECQGIKEEPMYEGGIVVGYTCSVKRKGHDEHTKSFTLKQAKAAGLLGKPGPWTQYLERMLQMRARVAIKDKFADALRGFKVVEIDEYDDATLIQGEVINTERPMSQTEKLKSILKNNSTSVEPVTLDINGASIDESIITYRINSVDETIEEVEKVKESVIETDNQPASSETINRIGIAMDERDFDDERRKKVLVYFDGLRLQQEGLNVSDATMRKTKNIEKLSDLTEAEAKAFFVQVGIT